MSALRNMSAVCFRLDAEDAELDIGAFQRGRGRRGGRRVGDRRGRRHLRLGRVRGLAFGLVDRRSRDGRDRIQRLRLDLSTGRRCRFSDRGRDRYLFAPQGGDIQFCGRTGEHSQGFRRIRRNLKAWTRILALAAEKRPDHRLSVFLVPDHDPFGIGHIGMRDPDTAERRATVPKPGIRALEDIGRLDVPLDNCRLAADSRGRALWRRLFLLEKRSDLGPFLAGGQK